MEENGDGEEVPLESVRSATGNGDGVEKDVVTRKIGMDLLNSEPTTEDTTEPENHAVGNEKDETLDAGAVTHRNGFQTSEASIDSFSSSSHLDNENSAKVHIDGEVKIAHEMVESDIGIVQTNDAQTGVDGISEELAQVESNEPKAVTDDLREIGDTLIPDGLPSYMTFLFPFEAIEAIADRQ